MAFQTHSHRTQRKPSCSAKHHADRNGGPLPEGKNHRDSEPRPSNKNTSAPHARQHSRRRPDLHHSQLGRSSAAPLDALGRKPPPPTAAAPLHLHAPEPAVGAPSKLHATPARTRCRPCTAQIRPVAPPRAPRADARNNGSIIFPVQNTTGLLGAAPHTEQKTQSTVYFDANISGTSRYNLQHVLQVGSFCFEVPPIEPKKDLVTPNFRTPPR